MQKAKCVIKEEYQMSSAAQNHSSSLRRCNAVPNETGDRYYLHHHAPDHYQNRPLHVISKHMSTSSLYQFMQNHVNDWNTPGALAKPGKNRRKSSMSTSQLNTVELQAKRLNSTVPKRVIRGHVLVMATCSRLRLLCESCQHTVHKHQYVYCRNCPVVCHARDHCINDIPRDCPSRDLGLEGWGESQCSIKVMDTTTLDLEAVFLSGMLGLQANKCFECGCVLDPSVGREYLSDQGCSKRASNGPAESGECTGHNSSKSLGLLPVNFARSNPNKESMYRRTSPTHLLQEPPPRMRICYMTGKYYCNRCHWNDQWYVPGSIFLLNDTSMHPLSRSAYLRLRVLWDSAIFRVPSYWHQENRQAAEAFRIRTQLHQLLRYTLVCSVASALKECAELTEPSHLLGYPNHMRMCDVLEILNGQLIEKLRHHLDMWKEHVQSCETCNTVQQTTDHDERLSMPDLVH